VKISLFLLCVVLFVPSSYSAESIAKISDQDLLGEEFGGEVTVMSKPQYHSRRVILLGKISRGTLSIAHFNDIDLTGISRYLGYPNDDDLGRTAGLVINYLLEGENGSLEFNLENWLFSIANGIEDEQTIEERSVVSIRSRRFTGNDNQSYMIIGLEFSNEVQSRFIMSFVQNFVHEITPSTHRPIINRSGNNFYVNPIFGVGGSYNILEHENINIYVTGELEAQASSRFLERSNVRLRSSLTTSLPVNSDHVTPLIRLRMFMEYAQFVNGEHESTFGLQLFFGINIGEVFFELGLSVYQFASRLDRLYEGEASYNTALVFRFSRRPRGEEENEEGDRFLIN
jgi:hypothetical protein